MSQDKDSLTSDLFLYVLLKVGEVSPWLHRDEFHLNRENAQWLQIPFSLTQDSRGDTVVLSHCFFLSSRHRQFIVAVKNKMSPRFSYSVNRTQDWSENIVFFLFLLSFFFSFLVGTFKNMIEWYSSREYLHFYLSTFVSLLDRSWESLIKFPFLCVCLPV